MSLRSRCTLSIRRAAKASGLNAGTLSRYERGLIVPKIETAAILAPLYEMSPREFWHACRQEAMIAAAGDRVIEHRKKRRVVAMRVRDHKTKAAHTAG